MRLFRMLVAGAIVAAGISAAAAQSAGEARGEQALEKRLKALEKLVEEKTGFYDVEQSRASKTWRTLRVKRSKSPPAIPQDSRFSFDVRVPSKVPVLATFWLTVQANYKDFPNPVMLSLSGVATVADIPAGFLFFDATKCAYRTMLPAGAGKINVDYTCQSVINPQVGEVFRLYLDFTSDTDIRMDQLNVSGEITMQVLASPPSR